MFFAMNSQRIICHSYPVIWKYCLHNDFQEILEIWISSCTLCPSIMRPKQRLISGQLHVMGKLHIKFQENRARNVLSVKNRNTYVMKFSFFEKNIFCLKSYQSAAWQDILHKKENQSLDLSFFKRLIFFVFWFLQFLCKMVTFSAAHHFLRFLWLFLKFSV